MAIAKITIYRNEAPSSGMRTSIGYNGLLQSGFTWNYYTNDERVADIEHTSTDRATVFINGQTRGTMKTQGSEVYCLKHIK